MVQKIIKIKGMTCSHCQQKITSRLKNTAGVIDAKVNLDKNQADVQYDESVIAIDGILSVISELGYTVSSDEVYDSEEEADSTASRKKFRIFGIVIGILSIYMIVRMTFGFDFLNLIPVIDSSVSFSLLFGIGVMTSIHCVGMCGSINLAASMGVKTKNRFRRPLLYNAGRIVSYTLIGGIAGLIGKVLAPSLLMQGILVGLASLFMLFMGLSMLGILPKKIISFLPHHKTKSSSPFVIGLLNGLMPCGPLQAMQVYAISTASFYLGAASMLLFALGTVPLMLAFGLAFNLIKGNKIYIMQQISAVMVLLLAVVMASRALGYLGFQGFVSEKSYEMATIEEDGMQYVRVDIKRNAYGKIVVQNHIPVQFDLFAESKDLNGCNNAIIIPEFDIKKNLKAGDNIVSFTPEESKTYIYSCWMSMIKSQIVVVDDIASYKE